MLLTLPESAHWYTKEGESRHDADLRMARKLSLLPSVTSIIKCAAKPKLEAWKQAQAVLSSLTLPRNKGETDDAFAKRVIVDMNAQSSNAAEFGTQVHKSIEHFHLKEPFLSKMNPWIIPYCNWFIENITEIIHAEKVLVNNRIGYAGTVDLVARHKEWGLIVLDVKTQGVKDKPVFYPDWAWQLAAYECCLQNANIWTFGPEYKLVSCIINSKEPSEPVFKVWDNQDEAWEAFLACHKLWCITKNFTPVTTE